MAQVSTFYDLTNANLAAVRQADDRYSLSAQGGDLNSRVDGLIQAALAEKFTTFASLDPSLRGRVVEQLRFDAQIPKDLSKFTVGDLKRALLNAQERFKASGGILDLIKEDPILTADDETTRLVKWILFDKSIEGKDGKIFTWKTIKAILFKKDPTLIKPVLEKFLAVANLLFTKLSLSDLDDSDRLILEILIGHILGFLPFFGLESKGAIRFPQKIEGVWRMVEFRVEKRQITPEWLSDPYCAYGLVPIDNESARPQLVFKGTTYLQDSGAAMTYLADFVPFCSVGEILTLGFSDVEKWLEDKKNVDVTGISLGASLALHAVTMYPEKFQTVNAYCPTALHSHSIRRFEEKCATLAKKPTVNVHTQDGDLVSAIGSSWGKEWHLFRFISKNRLNFFMAHLKAFTGQEKLCVVEMDVQKDSDRIGRKILNIVYQILLCVPIFIIMTVVLLIRFIIHGAITLLQKVASLFCKDAKPPESGDQKV